MRQRSRPDDACDRGVRTPWPVTRVTGLRRHDPPRAGGEGWTDGAAGASGQQTSPHQHGVTAAAAAVFVTAVPGRGRRRGDVMADQRRHRPRMVVQLPAAFHSCSGRPGSGLHRAGRAREEAPGSLTAARRDRRRLRQRAGLREPTAGQPADSRSVCAYVTTATSSVLPGGR